MLVLQNNKLVEVNLKEDDATILARKDISKLDKKYASKSVVYKLIKHGIESPSVIGKYNFQVIHSQYNDNSSLGNYYLTFKSKGEAIKKMIDDGFEITINGIEFNL